MMRANYFFEEKKKNNFGSDEMLLKYDSSD